MKPRKRAKSRQEPAPTPETPDTINPAPAMESAKDLTHQVTIQLIAPEHEFVLITIRDRFEKESRWMIPEGTVLSSEDMEILIFHHDHASQAETRRN